MQSRTNGSDRATEHFRTLCIAHFVQVTEHYRLAIMLGQRKDSLPHSINKFIFAQVEQRIASLNEAALEHPIVIGLRQSVLNKWSIPFEPSHDLIPRNTVEKRQQRAFFRIEATSGMQQGHKHLLNDILCRRLRSSHLQGESVYRALPFPEKRHKGIFISLQNEGRRSSSEVNAAFVMNL
jgi:hypothetical protein